MARKDTDAVSRVVGIFRTDVDRPIRLEAECVASRVRQFCKRYRDLTGSNPPSEDFYEFPDTSKWGNELRIYFNCSIATAGELQKLGFNVEDGQPFNPDYRCRINNNTLWWALIKAGFRLGTNH